MYICSFLLTAALHELVQKSEIDREGRKISRVGTYASSDTVTARGVKCCLKILFSLSDV